MVKNINDLNSIHIDVLREIGNIGAGNAATALAKLLNRKIDMDIPRVKIMDFREVSETLGGAELPVAGIMLKVTGDLTGNILFVLKQQAAVILVNMLMGKPLDSIDDTDESYHEFDEMEISALKEIGNILAGSYLSSLSTLTNLNIAPSVPDLAIDMAGAILSVPAIEFGKVGDTVLYIETEFTEGDKRVVGDFFLIPDVDTYSVLMNALGVSF
ncbi:MAG: chemotaxis protein CheC [Clostridiaceae bacterium]|jgi:chemotaxis protein CheC|nr:chemotaxis protein CheC [Bacillota bacterium]NLP08445.1 chemotaxis protein CheC [Clostridiaceae bacterium]HOA55542.1 chemotaxis protein CheC [Clostridiales bacterium]HQD31272.1 chemotaxis protein CheC [Clostridiales bacterium]